MTFKLHDACKKGDLVLIKQYANEQTVNQLDNHGVFAINILVGTSNYDGCKYLIDKFKIDPFKRNDLKSSAIATTIESNELDIFKLFMDSKEFYTKSSYKHLLCELACVRDDITPIEYVILINHVYCVRFLNVILDYFKEEIDVSHCKQMLFYSLKYFNTSVIKYMLIDNAKLKLIIEKNNLLNWHLNMQVSKISEIHYDDANTTPLLYAISSSNNELIKILLNNSTIDLNLANKPLCNQLPLQQAVYMNNLEIVKLLIDKNVNKKQCCNDINPLQSAVLSRYMYRITNYKSTDAKKNFEIIKLLANSKADVYECSSNGLCAFDFAIQNELKDVCEYFCDELKADAFNFKNKSGMTPIEYMSSRNNDFTEFMKNKLKFK